MARLKTEKLLCVSGNHWISLLNAVIVTPPMTDLCGGAEIFTECDVN